jgi:uncharacterized Zn finger protein (UPF0148 family)
MRDPSGKEDVCVQCGKTFPVGQSSTATNHASPSVEVKENDPTTQIEDNEMENKADASMLLADRMVQGWKMLAEHCPVCQTPLLEKNRSMYCVSCDLPVRKQKGDENMKENSATRNVNVVAHDGGNESVDVGQDIVEYMKKVSSQLRRDCSVVEAKDCLDRINTCADILCKLKSIGLS